MFCKKFLCIKILCHWGMGLLNFEFIVTDLKSFKGKNRPNWDWRLHCIHLICLSSHTCDMLFLSLVLLLANVCIGTCMDAAIFEGVFQKHRNSPWDFWKDKKKFNIIYDNGRLPDLHTSWHSSIAATQLTFV